MICLCFGGRRVGEILFVGDLLHPGDGRAVLAFLDGDVGHGFVRGRAVPVLVLGGAPQDVAGVEFQLRSALDLGPADAFGDDQGLAQRMDVPGGACAGVEDDSDGLLGPCAPKGL